MQGFQFIQALHENRHTIEKVVYPFLYGLANVTLPNGAYDRCDHWGERRSVALYARNAVT